MEQKQRLLATLVLSTFLYTGSGASKPNKIYTSTNNFQPSTKKSIVSPSTTYHQKKHTTEIIDTSTLTPFQAKYKGDEIVKEYHRLTKQFPPKEEFEKTEDYKKRALSEEKEFYFVQETTKFEPTITYNADTENLNISMLMLKTSKFMSSTDEKDYKPVKIYTLNKPKKQYVGQNAFGTKVIVDKYSDDCYGIAIKNYSFEKLDFNIKVDPATAKELVTRNAMKIAWHCKIPSESSSRITTKATYHASPTIDLPTSITENYYLIVADILDISVFDEKTGKIYYRQIIK